MNGGVTCMNCIDVVMNKAFIWIVSYSYHIVHSMAQKMIHASYNAKTMIVMVRKNIQKIEKDWTSSVIFYSLPNNFK